MIRREHRRTYADVALALVLLIGQLAAFLHLAIAPHEICLQHGELVERTGRSRNFHVVAQQIGAAPTVSSTAVDNHASHDLCLTALVENDGVDITAASALIVFASSAHRTRLSAAPSGESSPCVYRLAPKTSPPV